MHQKTRAPEKHEQDNRVLHRDVVMKTGMVKVADAKIVCREPSRGQGGHGMHYRIKRIHSLLPQCYSTQESKPTVDRP